MCHNFDVSGIISELTLKKAIFDEERHGTVPVIRKNRSEEDGQGANRVEKCIQDYVTHHRTALRTSDYETSEEEDNGFESGPGSEEECNDGVDYPSLPRKAFKFVFASKKEKQLKTSSAPVNSHRTSGDPRSKEEVKESSEREENLGFKMPELLEKPIICPHVKPGTPFTEEEKEMILSRYNTYEDSLSSIGSAPSTPRSCRSPSAVSVASSSCSNGSVASSHWTNPADFSPRYEYPSNFIAPNLNLSNNYSRSRRFPAQFPHHINPGLLQQLKGQSMRPFIPSQPFHKQPRKQ